LPISRFVKAWSDHHSTSRSYNQPVARGWESKSIEQQQEESRSAQSPGLSLTPAQREAENRKQGLKLSRSRVLDQIQAAQNPHYRKILEQALSEIEEQLSRPG
jgi:vacuolar-type H+-ATPase subunit E/Vma4